MPAKRIDGECGSRTRIDRLGGRQRILEKLIPPGRSVPRSIAGYRLGSGSRVCPRNGNGIFDQSTACGGEVGGPDRLGDAGIAGEGSLRSARSPRGAGGIEPDVDGGRESVSGAVEDLSGQSLR